MVTLQQLNDNTVAMRCNFAYKDRCKSIPGAHFNKKHKTWVAPLRSLSYIQREFRGEIYYKTPLWKILGEDPPKTEIRFLGDIPELPELKVTPYSYQCDGIRFMIDRLENMGFCLNADQVGLGKTLQSVGTMKWYADRGVKKFLIICKKSIKSQWASEIQKFADMDMPVFITGSTKAKRLKAYAGMTEADKGILITNYHNFLNDADEIRRTGYEMCIIDEAHCIKARKGVMNNEIGDTVRGYKTILLTGTPIMSKPDDIYGIVHMVDAAFFGTYSQFKRRYIVTEWGMFGEQIIGAKNLDELQAKIQSFLITRTAEEVRIQLPKRLPSKQIICEMDSVQEKIQNAINVKRAELDDDKRELLEHIDDDDAKLALEALNDKGKMFLASLQFAADDPAILRDKKGGFNGQLSLMVPKNYKMSAKTEAAIEVAEEFIDADEKVIIFCHFASSARMLKQHFEKIKGANPVLYTGNESDEQREINLAAFNNDPETRVLIGTEAMAEGLNLQISRNVINYEQADTYAQRTQRIGRVRRIGSVYTTVNVVDLITENSFDEVKIRKLKRDKELTESLIG